MERVDGEFVAALAFHATVTVAVIAASAGKNAANVASETERPVFSGSVGRNRGFDNAPTEFCRKAQGSVRTRGELSCRVDFAFRGIGDGKRRGGRDVSLHAIGSGCEHEKALRSRISPKRQVHRIEMQGGGLLLGECRP